MYRVSFDGHQIALKWYYPQYLQSDLRLKERLESAIRLGAPTDHFLWPIELVESADRPDFGYIMPLRETRFKGIVDMMKRRTEPSFRAIVTACVYLAHNYHALHTKGLCYRDISFGNVFFDPDTGEVRICDNDNVDVNGKSGGILGTMRFMAPEIVRGESMPDQLTDLYSLAVLMFYMLVVHHPLEGMKESSIHAMDTPAMLKLYGTEPIFIYDPQDQSNRPDPKTHGNAISFWQLYPTFIRDRFCESFTVGLRDPGQRVRESIWRKDMARLRDAILYCGHCGMENFYDADALRAAGSAGTCWSCKRPLQLPYRMRIGQAVVMLNHDSRLYRHHISDDVVYDYTQPVAQVVQSPHDKHVWGLRNLTNTKWSFTRADGSMGEVLPNQSLMLAPGVRVQFGNKEGTIR